jgi:selenocysteine-specific elongation factor
MIVGTAGHIDHGKTALVRALTGVNTDRLPEEKKRGISIELGYAYLPVDGLTPLGFIDVPGHERFVHTMLSGATGIDFGLLVVAADDGVMPQTREHLAVLHLLGVTQGACAITKIDRVPAERVREVESEVGHLLSLTRLADLPVFPVSNITGEGVEVLRDHLLDVHARIHRKAAGGGFRLAVDRVFTLEGAGTVVTGTVFAGEVCVGDEIRIVPGDRRARVRSLRAQNRAAVCGRAGDRCALALAGIELAEVARGQWITDPRIASASERVDVRVELLPDVPKPLRSGAAVHLHVGAAHAIGRIAVLDAESLPSGTTGLLQVVLQHRLGLWAGDRVVLRDATAAHTLGGGVVLDPMAPVRYRRTPDRLALLAALDEPDTLARVAGVLRKATAGVDLDALGRSWGVADVELLIRDVDHRRVRQSGVDLAFAPAHWTRFADSVVVAVDAFHARHPDEPGVDLARLARMSFARVESAVVQAAADALVQDGRLARQGVWLMLPEHAVRLSEQERVFAERIRPLLADTPFDPPWVRDIAAAIGQPEMHTRVLLNRLAKSGIVYQIVRDLFYDAQAISKLAAIAQSLQAESGELRAAAFRDRTGLGRKRAIQVLEFFDRIGFTRRIRARGDDKHVLRANHPLHALVVATPPAQARPTS